MTTPGGHLWPVGKVVGGWRYDGIQPIAANDQKRAG
jgi:hypothetical protein